MNRTPFKKRLMLLLTIMFELFVFQHGNAKDIYVTKSGDDTNAGTLGSPYRTITKAALIALAGDVVHIGAGTYEETLISENSGTADKPITYQSIEGEEVIITAMQALNNWVPDEGSIFKTQIDWDLGQRNFVMNGLQVLDLARWPNNTDGDLFTLNSLRNDGGSQDSVSVDAFLTDTEIPDWNWSNGGSVMFYGDRPGSGWTTWRTWIKGQSKGRIDFDAIKRHKWIITYHPPGDLGDYYLEGIKEALDYDNEWYFDSATKTLYVLLPGGHKPTAGDITMARREYTVDINNKNHIHIKNVSVIGGCINIKGTGNYLFNVTSLYGSMTRGISPNYNSGVNSIFIDERSVNTRIEKCEVGFGAGTGIWDSGAGTTITKCYVHDFDMLGSYDAPVMMRGKSGAKLISNKITRGGRDAIQITSRGAEVAYNDVSYSNLIADDCGLIYTIGGNLEIEIHHNWFHDAKGRGKLYKAAGIYLDSGSDTKPNPEKVNVYNNVVWNVEWTNIQINWNGTDINIFNNTLCKAVRGTMGAWHKPGTAFSNVNVWNNITDKESIDQKGNQESETTWEPQSDKQNNLIDKTSFKDYANNEYFLKKSGPAVDSGKKIPGYTDNYFGEAPDAGAYEYGLTPWIPGVNTDFGGKNME